MNLNAYERERAALQSVPAWRRALYLDAGIGGAYTVFVGGTVLTGAILWAGGGGFELGLVSALTTAGGLIVLLMGRLQRRIKSHRDLTRFTWTAARAAWLPAAVLLLTLEITGTSRLGAVVPVLLVTVLVASALAGVGNVTWYPWLAELVSSNERGHFLAQRARWLSVASLVVLPIVGYILDKGAAIHHQAVGFGIVLGLAALTAVVGWRVLGSVPHANPSAAPVGSTGRARRKGAISPGRLAWYTGVWQVAVYLSAPFFQAYAIGRLGMSFGVLMDLQILSQVIPILTLGWWGQIVDRIGLRLPLGVCSLAKGVVPLCYLVSTPGVWWPVVLVYVLSVLDAGITIANGSAMAHLADGHHGSARIAHLSLLTAITASVTPLVAGYLVARGQFAGLDLLVVLFILSAIGRSLSGLILLRPEGPRRRLVVRTRVAVPTPEVG
jgi:hypothetical protein